jgi:hypothetical protein
MGTCSTTLVAVLRSSLAGFLTARIRVGRGSTLMARCLAIAARITSSVIFGFELSVGVNSQWFCFSLKRFAFSIVSVYG